MFQRFVFPPFNKYFSAFYVSGAMRPVQETGGSPNSCPVVTQWERVQQEKEKEASNHSYCTGALAEMCMHYGGNVEEGPLITLGRELWSSIFQKR